MSERAVRFYRGLMVLWDGIEKKRDGVSELAFSFLEALAGNGSDTELPEPFRSSVKILHREFDDIFESDRKKAFENLEELLDNLSTPGGFSEEIVAETLWAAFFPEAMYLSPDPEEQIVRLRSKRVIHIERLAPDPIQSPASQMLFTSNVLLSPPVISGDAVQEIDVSDEIKRVVDAAAETGKEKQLYWYDHPIPVGTALENDEAVYGLAGLARTLAFEKERGNAEAGARLNVLLSVSVTHSGLREWALPWLRAQIESAEKNALEDLDVFAFTENDTEKIVEILRPWLADSGEFDLLKKTFGVDGEYGRHYSFLKALPALWAVLENPELKATFKIDLDQVFPQKELVAETGKSAFEHFKTPLWGAFGKDSENREIELGMIAGALVNEKDIVSGLFTPDIPWPETLPKGENLFFYKLRPMAVSSRAELMTRYGGKNSGEALDGESTALHRIHVTGGTNGIRFDALRRHRPFTPGFIGRAEDQGYLLSVLSGKSDNPLLRYAHASGLVMRHDKEAFAGDAVKAGKAGSYVGDLVRLFVFSYYSEFLPGGSAEVKREIDPFTGCFITPFPATLALLRLALHLLDTEASSYEDRKDLLVLAGERLPAWINKGEEKAVELKDQWITERNAWDSYYDALDRLEKALSEENPDALESSKLFKVVLEHCRIT